MKYPLFALVLAFAGAIFAHAKDIVIATNSTKMELRIEKDGTLTARGYGLLNDNLPQKNATDEMAHQFDFYPTFGDGYLDEPALQITHSNGDISTKLVVADVKSDTDAADKNIIRTEILLKDTVQNLRVTLYFRAFQTEDIIQIWTKIENNEDGAILLKKFASASPMNFSNNYHLTQFHGGWANEGNMVEEKLTHGKKTLFSNLMSRAHRMQTPMFMVSLNNAINEDSAFAIGATLMWPGSFEFTFDVNSANSLRMLVGANCAGGDYFLEKNQSLETPKSLWVFTTNGTGGISRKFHAWAKKYAVRNPEKPRPVLLNNWEATGFDFNEERLVALFEKAKGTGIDVFLLDDGWFGNKYPRNNDTQALGDWEENKNKLPHGIKFLTQEAQKRGLKFGIWLEPEMISPKSELAEKHGDWRLQSPQRDAILGRNQQVLDLTNPAVQKFIGAIFERTLKPNGVSYVKWDANCSVYQPTSSFLPKQKQGNLDFEYNRCLLEIMKKFSRENPQLMAMLCSGGGGRTDYASLENFDSFWPSDNTDPLRRVYIQWGFSHFFPPYIQSAHVTHWGNRPMKFALDVAMSGALGFDIDFSKLSENEIAFFKNAIALYKKEIQPLVQNGTYLQLKSPYKHAQSAVSFATENGDRAAVFVYQTRNDTDDQTVKFKGLNPEKNYIISEVNLPDGATPKLSENDTARTGKFLMETGLKIPTEKECGSAILLMKTTE